MHFSDLFYACILLLVCEDFGRGSLEEMSRLDKIAHILKEN